MAAPLLAELLDVLGRYGLREQLRGDPLRAGSGFSGADVYKVETTLGPFCVRRWPSEHPTAPELVRIHALLTAAIAGGCCFVPTPLRARDSNTVTLHGGRLWEVTPWMLGSPDLSPRVSDNRLAAIWRALAAFHAALFKQGPLGGVYYAPRIASPALAERRKKLDDVEAVGLTALRNSPLPEAWRSIVAQRDEYVQLFPAAVRLVRRAITAAADDPVELAVCIRDIRREHILFTNYSVSGWVDFGAVALESPAIDMARILGEFCDDRRVEWPTLLTPYEEACRGTPFPGVSFHLIDAFDQSGVLLAPWNWLRWLLLEGREFTDRRAVTERLELLMRRLRRLVETA